jgi:hypothetical protein
MYVLEDNRQHLQNNCLKYRQLYKESSMKTLPIFPKLPTGLPEEELRQEIRRRLALSEQLGLIKRRKQSCRKLTKVDTSRM